MTAYTDLMTFTRQTEALSSVAGLLGWDMETMLPPGAAPQRAEESAALAAAIHQRRTDPRLGEWLERAAPADAAEAAQIRHIRREYDRAILVPERLATALARESAASYSAWEVAHRADDWKSFVPRLEALLVLIREKAQALTSGGPLYDAMLDEYEPGATSAEVATIFDSMRPRLVALRERLLGAPVAPNLRGEFSPDVQLGLSRKLAEVFGYDLDHGRIDRALHPFSSGSGLDVRITTRTSATDPFNCIYSTIHEVGHATYEQAIDRAYLLTPLGRGASLGVHESQSRIYENQLGRSRAFTGWLYVQMRDAFGDFGVSGPDDFYRVVNAVRTGYIRTEADEVHYNLHIMLRFDLERGLVSGDLAVADLEAAWNDSFKADFGLTIDRPRNGVLQDVHWPSGAFGYFPTYALGNVYAGCLNQALNAAVPDLDAALAAGDPRPATAWLREALQQHGGLRLPRETITQACGFEPHEGPLLDYLEAKFGALYGL